MLERVSTDLNFLKREEEILDLWQKRDTVRRALNQNKGGKVFSFYEGPPTANGAPHIGHVLTRVIKDIIPRYHAMKGEFVPRQAGWDTHGLPVELEVEKQLGLDGKPQIEIYGVEPFIKECKKSVWKYKVDWERMSQRVGFWLDFDAPYITYENDYIESVWWSLKTVAEKGLLYKGHKVVPYCPRCGTALSSHEVAQGYKDVTDTSAIVRFPVKDRANTHILAWTTTPWTLPSNVALTVNAKETYVEYVKDGQTYILAKALLGSVFGENAGGTIQKEMTGQELYGLNYLPLFEYNHLDARADAKLRAHYVVCDSYVTLTDGTGIVHTAPAFGEDDARVGRDNHLPFVQLVNPEGKFVDGTPWAGQFVKDADAPILETLKERGQLFAAMPYQHSYPFCWRCDTPLLYYARATWFIRMTAVRENLLKNNASIDWMPDNIKDGRMGNFLDNVLDWGLSRERYWGTPLPVWLCECGHMHVIGSRTELQELGENIPADLELHKPYIDQVIVKCPKCGQKMKRESEVIDCWYDSGAMPFAQLHYPFENCELFETNFPAQFISEAIDQTRGWFYTLLAISTLLFDKSSYEHCIVLGHVQDANGVKMSKHIGNVISPWEVLDKQGADAVRWYFYTAGAPWLPSRFSHELVSEVQRKFMGTLWNTYAFFTLYASIDGFTPELLPENMQYSVMDRWILSKLNSLIAYVDEGLSQYKITETARAMQSFVDELSNWYVRRCRERFWGSAWTSDKLAAFGTLYTVLVTFAKLSAPYVPFMAESMYQNLVYGFDNAAPDSVHLCSFPIVSGKMIDKTLEKEMDAVVAVVQLGRAARTQASLKIRQPLSNAYVNGLEMNDAGLIAEIADELNVKSVEFSSDARAYTTYNLKPQLRTVGPKYGKLVGKIGELLKTVDGNMVVDTFERGECFALFIDGVEVILSKDDILTERTQKPGYVAQSERGVTVALATTITPELAAEGYVREVVSKLQTLRKESGFEVTDRIGLSIDAPEPLCSVVKDSYAGICASVLAQDDAQKTGDIFEKTININGIDAHFAIWKCE